jgi:DNA modification methylase
MNLLLNANAKRIPVADKSVDMVFTSPPFKDEDVIGDYWSNYDAWMEEIFRVASKVVIIINSVNRLEGIVEAYPADRYLVWSKGITQTAYRWNPIFVYQLGDYKVNKYIWCDAFGVASVVGKWKVHAYQDPLLLYKTIIEMFKDCKTVLDPFMGSGTTGVACKLLDLDFIGMDIDEDCINTAYLRIKKGRMPVNGSVNQLTLKGAL